MKVVLLAGGLGTRISEESHLRPKPMIEIGDKPILWHIMKIYSYYGFNEFIICTGYKSYIIKEYFANYYLHNSDITYDFADNNKIEVHSNIAEPWKVTIVDTGLETMTGGRLKRIQKYIGTEPLLMTYGDGVADLNIADTVSFHKKHGKAVTMTCIQPTGRFGVVEADAASNLVTSFKEKPQHDESWINAGFFVLESSVFDYLQEDKDIFERRPLEAMASAGNVTAYKHKGFWQCMDTLRDKSILDELWNTNKAPWKIW